jgi:hypothetical protein
MPNKRFGVAYQAESGKIWIAQLVPFIDQYL